jgi:hypothetical protein
MMAGSDRRGGPLMLLLAVLTIVTTGCQSAGERLTEAAAERALGATTGEDVDLDLREGRMSVETDEGSFSVGAATEVPDRIAAAMPVPAGFEPLQTFEQRDGDQQGVSVSGRLTGADLESVLDDLETALTGDGWEVVNRMNLNDQILSLHLEREGAVVNINGAVEGDDAMLTLMLLDEG